MLVELNNYDWAEAFGEGSCQYNCPPLKPRKLTLVGPVTDKTFTREDVETIHGIVDGDREGPDWIVWGKLKDGRWFSVTAGCDYTGWDCQAGNSSTVQDTREELVLYGLTDGERKRFGIDRGGKVDTEGGYRTCLAMTHHVTKSIHTCKVD